MTSLPSFDYTFVEDYSYDASKEQRTDTATGRCYEEYFPDQDLVEAVQLAIDLQQPLLLEGEPGSGKTQLASAIVYQLTCNNRLKGTIAADEWWPFHTWTVKSYSRARDGLYTFDAIGRLRDAQLMGSNVGEMLNAKTIAEIKDPKTYREFGALGKALYDKETKKPPEKRAVVLIDEVDKADSDFTNDLLLELDEFRFDIPETEEKINPPTQPPIVILTSNREKPLPDAFLRRCLYFKIKFPEDDLKRIAQKRFLNLVATQDAFIQPIIDRFLGVRQAMNQPGSRAPGTSEFLKLLEAVDRRFSKVKTIEELNKILDDLPSSLPLLGTLLKTEADQQLYLSKAQKLQRLEDVG